MNTRPGQMSENEDNQSESSSGSTCSSCNYSDVSIPEWDNSIQENGDMFFIKCSPIIQGVRTNRNEYKSAVARSKSNKFSTFLRKSKPKKCKNVADVMKREDEITSLPKVLVDPQSAKDRFDNLSEHPVAVLFLSLASIENNESEASDTFYYFPQAADKNVIHMVRGALITLYHLLPKLISEKPESSTIYVKGEVVHLIFIAEQKNLLILVCPENRCSLFKLKQLGISIKHYLNFKYRTLYETFSNPTHHTNLNQFFGSLFIKLLSNKYNLSESDICDTNIKDGKTTRFEQMFVFPRLMTISYSLMSKIHDKLNELEANDFGDLSEDHYGSQRLFSIIGTCVYYKGHLVVNHLNQDDLIDVHSFLCLNDVLDLTITSVIESLIVWQEVYLSSYVNGQETFGLKSYNRRWFLLVVGKEHSLLVALLESGGCSVSNMETSRPDELYVEQVQDTLSDLLHLGISDEVEQCSRSASSRSTNITHKSSKKSTDISMLNSSPISNTFRRSGDYTLSCSFKNDSSVNLHSVPNGTQDDTFSESISRTTSSAFSEETYPVLGRRAQRLQQLNNSGSVYTLSQSILSDSDHSDYDTTGSSHESSSIGSKHSTKNTKLCGRVIHGDEKALFHYINLRNSRGVILFSLKACDFDVAHRCQSIANNFELSAQQIHTMLSQKKMSSSNRFQRNGLPIKEYGLLFEYNSDIEEDGKKGLNTTTYWVVGRTFKKPQLGEVYVCYEDKTPQNLVEIAVRLAMLS